MKIGCRKDTLFLWVKELTKAIVIQGNGIFSWLIFSQYEDNDTQ
jgi:hypothetical protein